MDRLFASFSNLRRSAPQIRTSKDVAPGARRVLPRLASLDRAMSRRKNPIKEFTMQAHVGDSIRITVLSDPPLVGEIVEVLGPDGAPPYRVKFPNGHELVMNPSPDTIIEHRRPR